MILPGSYATALVLTIISMLCWGSWANTFKLTKKWRFELFYFDYAFGVAAAALIAAFTFGSMGDELSFLDNLLYTAGKRHIAWALVAGGIFNLANLLLVAAISITGLAVAFPIGIGLALVIGVIWSFILRPAGNPALLFGGAFLVLLAVVVDALAYRVHAETTARKKKFSLKGLVLSLVSGVLMGSFYPLVEMSKAPEVGLGPYTVGAVFATGVLITTFVYNLYFMNLPVQGEPISFSAYFGSKSGKNHLLGFLGGVIWSTGAVANFVAAGAPAEVNVGPAIAYALGQGATMISVLWGLLIWKEFAGANQRVKLFLGLMMALFITGLGMVSIASLD
jgi:glucose uptake protein